MGEWQKFTGDNKPDDDENVEVDLGRGKFRKGGVDDFFWVSGEEYGCIHRFRIIPKPPTPKE